MCLLASVTNSKQPTAVQFTIVNTTQFKGGGEREGVAYLLASVST